jgi:hypothetical protein
MEVNEKVGNGKAPFLRVRGFGGAAGPLSNQYQLIQNQSRVRLAVPRKGHFCRSLVRISAGSARILHQPDKMRFEEEGAPFPIEHLTSLTTYLTTYPSGSMGFRAGRMTYPRAQIGFLRGSMGVYGGPEAPT